MRYKQIPIIFTICLLGAGAITVSAQPYMTVDESYTYDYLVEEVLLNNTACAEVDNIVGLGALEQGTQGLQSIGYFENQNLDFPMEYGIVLATGGIGDIPGPMQINNTEFVGSVFQNGGDSEFNAYLAANENITPPGTIPATYNDASYLEFHFTSFTDSISFNFVFASNEYGTFQCFYSDPFAFFLEDLSTGQVINMAVLVDPFGNPIPGAGGDEIPISTITIRDQLYNATCSSENPQFFDKCYDQNSGNGLPITQAPAKLDGHTVKMQAWSYVTPHQTYRMKMVIQDRSDWTVDSAVFIEGGSFFIGEADLGDDIAFDSENSDCYGNPIELEVDDLGPDCDYVWTYNGTVIPGADSYIVTAEEPGLYGVEIICGGGEGCTLSDEIMVEFRVQPELPPDWGQDIVACGPDVDVTLVATPDNVTDLHQIDYAWYQDGIKLSHADSYYHVTQPGAYTVIVSELDCTDQETIVVEQAYYEVDAGDEIQACDDGGSYTLTADVQDRGSWPAMDPGDVQYLWSTGETTQSIEVSQSGTYWVEAMYKDCTETDEVKVTLAAVPEVDLGADFQICFDDTEVVLEAAVNHPSPEILEYRWYEGGAEVGQGRTLNVPTPLPAVADHDYVYFTVEAYEPGATFCPGESTVGVKYYDNKNCIIPQGISPTATAGMNDAFDLQWVRDKSDNRASIKIYNRYGTLVYEEENYADQWDGYSNDGELLPVGMYFYRLDYPVEGGEVETLTGFVYVNY